MLHRKKLNRVQNILHPKSAGKQGENENWWNKVQESDDYEHTGIITDAGASQMFVVVFFLSAIWHVIALRLFGKEDKNLLLIPIRLLPHVLQLISSQIKPGLSCCDKTISPVKNCAQKMDMNQK